MDIRSSCFVAVSALAPNMAFAESVPLSFRGADAEDIGSGALWRWKGIASTDADTRHCALPLVNTSLAGSKPLVPLGGDYWPQNHLSHHSFGHQGTCWFRVDSGELASPLFTATRFVSLRARGAGRIELRDPGGKMIAQFILPPTIAGEPSFNPMSDIELDAGKNNVKVRVV